MHGTIAVLLCKPRLGGARESMSHDLLPLSLPARFSFAEFRKVTPIDESSLCPLLLERNAERIKVKRRATAEINLRAIFLATFRLANR